MLKFSIFIISISEPDIISSYKLNLINETMKKVTFLILVLICSISISKGQIGYSTVVDSLINLITEQSISDLDLQLSGQVPVMVGGDEFTIESRFYDNATNAIAAQWIYEQFESLGLQTEYQYFGSLGENVVATITGTTYPDQQYIICAHYDDVPWAGIAPGADDNASGTVAVLEAARLLANMNPLYTVKFIAFDEEEIGLVGSFHYADLAAAAGDNILGVLNLDMIGYDSDDDNELSIAVNTQSLPFSHYFTSAIEIYEPSLNYNFISTTSSDHSPFWVNDYQAILAIEDWEDFNAYYHTPDDLLSNMNVPYFLKMVRASVATFASLALDFKMTMTHEPIQSSPNTNDREAVLVVQSGYPIPTGDNAPRLYYSINDGSYDFVNPFFVSQDTLKFIIPGQDIGTGITYYLAVQDEGGNVIMTLPYGGNGFNPPGTITPPEVYDYFIGDLLTLEYCSETIPKTIIDLQNTFDTIFIEQDAVVVDINVMMTIGHPRDGDLDIYLEGPNGTEIELSTGNGANGANYVNTIFDDDAEISIVDGTAPFMGTYQPEMPLSTFAATPMNGDWVLRVYDNASGSEGTLVNYCVEMMYYIEPVGVTETAIALSTLYQNYPNPFFQSTRIGFEMIHPDVVTIDVFDMMGRKVMNLTNKHYDQGNYMLNLEAGSLTPGRYFYRMETSNEIIVKSMTMLR